MSDNHNNINNKICPICGAENRNSSSYCFTCGWEFKEFPSTNSPYIIQERKRKEISKSYIERILADSERKKNTITKIQEELDRAKKTVCEKLKELDNVQKNLKRANKSIEEQELNIKTLKDSKDKVCKKLTETSTELDKVKNDLEITKKELENLRNNPQPIPAATSSATTLKGVVCMKNLGSEALCYLPVYEGVQSYGMAPESNGHHQIKMRIRGINIPDMLFTVQFRNDRIVVQDLSKGLLTYNGMQISANGIYVDANTKIFLQDILEIHISKI